MAIENCSGRWSLCLGDRVIDQARRRVLLASIATDEKIYSIFEPIPT